MASNSIKWTPQQRDAIESRGDVLVTASAGTGKTAVLSRRCVEIVGDAKNPVDVDRILVLTFTEAAADEMKGRIAQTLRDEYRQTGNRRLKKQLLLLDAADISTIHAFCRRIIADNFHVLGIDPKFELIDADEQDLIKHEVLEQIVEEAWNSDDLKIGLEKLLSRRKVSDLNSGFLSQVIKVSEIISGVASREKWFERTEFESVEEARIAQEKLVKEKVVEAFEQVEHAIALNGVLIDGYFWKTLGEIRSGVAKLVSIAESGDMEKLYEQIDEFLGEKRKYRNVPKGSDKSKYELVKGVAKDALGDIAELRNLAVVNPRYEQLVGSVEGFEAKVFVRLLAMFERAYANRKAELNCLDFSDLEHLAFKLLVDEDGCPSDIAAGLREKYDCIFVDEYQDVNELQDSIVRLVSRGSNLFVVGDVKQSIYSWRQARPEIFLEHLSNASVEKNAAGERRLDLNANFRSRKEVLDFANMLFAKLMTQGLGGMEYDEDAMLRSGAEYLPFGDVSKESAAIEVHVIDDTDTSGDEDNSYGGGRKASDSDACYALVEKQNLAMFAEDASAAQKEAAFIANRIKQLVGGDGKAAEMKIFDRKIGSYRDVRYGDIVILMRSLSKSVNEYVEVLRLAGVPVNSSVAGGYFETTEITDCLCLLKVLDNPQRDIEFASVLRSPIFGFTDDELARIRIDGNGGRSGFYKTVQEYSLAGEDEGLRSKTEKALETLSDWRAKARSDSLAEVIWHILRESGYLSFVTALPNGSQRRANLFKLHERAIQFEGFVSSGSCVSLGRFVEFVERLLESGSDWTEAEPESDSDSGVQIMSIHKSKGLEFPVVFLAGLGKKFNRREYYGDCLADEKFTVGLRIVEQGKKAKLASLRHQMISQRQIAVSTAEELRILYVAITRAREKLIMTGAMKSDKVRDIVMKAALAGGGSLPGWMLKRANSHLHWILCGMSGERGLHSAVGIDAEEFCSGFEDDSFGSGFERDSKLGSEGSVDSKVCAAVKRGVDSVLSAEAEKLGVVLAGNDCASEESSVKFGIIDDTKVNELYAEAFNKKYVSIDFGNERNQNDGGESCFDSSDDFGSDSGKRGGASKSEGLRAETVLGSNNVLTNKRLSEDGRKIIEKVKSNLAWEYPYKSSVTKISKSSVSQLTHQDDEYSVKDFSGALSRVPSCVEHQGESGAGVSRRLIGTATHLLIQKLDLEGGVSHEKIKRRLEELVREGLIISDVAKKIRTDTVFDFFESELGKAVLESDAVYREWPFTIADNTNAAGAGNEAGEEGVIVQGIVDMVVEVDAGLVVIDFKTDHVRKNDVLNRASKYKTQIEYYGRAAEAILCKEVVESWLYFLNCGEGVRMT